MHSFYWYDYETFGDKPKTNRIAQFAGIRTDENLNVLDEKMLYCQPSDDCLPSPYAVAITKITPQLCKEKGLIEHKFISQVNKELSKPYTCTVGYNNIRFDDEFTRHTLYRNFIDPYAWSYKNSNSRWDIIDVVRMCYALKKDDSLNWVYENNLAVMKLDKLAPNNGIKHESAHDALADVRATIAIAKIIKNKQPKLFNYALTLRDKQNVKKQIKLFEPMLHTSNMYGAQNAFTRRCIAINYHPRNNSVIVFNLDQDPDILLDLTIDELKKLLFSKTIDLPDNTERLQLKELSFNKSPMFIANINKINNNIIEHLKIDIDKTNKHLKYLQQHKKQISSKILELYQEFDFPKSNDVEQNLYNKFLSNKDRNIANTIQSLDINGLANFKANFENKDLNTLFIHFKARNYPQTLNKEEQEYWFEVVQNRIQIGKNNYLSISEFEEQLKDAKQQNNDKLDIWNDLEQYIQNII